MNPYSLKKEWKKLSAFLLTIKLALKKITAIQAVSLKKETVGFLTLCYFIDPFKWMMADHYPVFYRSDKVIVLPYNHFPEKKKQIPGFP